MGASARLSAMTEINLFKYSSDAYDAEAGHVLFSEGEVGTTMYAVVSGRVDLVTGGHVLESVGPGGILGELALIDDSPRSASAVVEESARLVPVDAVRFKRLVQDHPTFALQVMTVMAGRLRRANRAGDPAHDG
jgi:CRP-like cAMP-binding protein